MLALVFSPLISITEICILIIFTLFAAFQYFYNAPKWIEQ